MTARFIPVLARPWDDLVERKGLTLIEEVVLLKLVLWADPWTAICQGTQLELAERFGMDRKNMRTKLDRLAALDLTENYFPRGHTGAIRVLIYLDVVHMPKSQGEIHPLRKGNLPPLRTARRPGPQGALRPITRGEKPQANRGCHSVSAEDALVEPFAHGGEDDEDADRARVLVQKVVDIKSRMKRDTVIPFVGDDETGRATTAGAQEYESTHTSAVASSSSACPSMTRVSAGGGREPTPVHPRSRSASPSSSSTTVRGLRDPRAMGGAS